MRLTKTKAALEIKKELLFTKSHNMRIGKHLIKLPD